MFHNGTPTFSKQGFSPGFWTQCIHIHAYGHTYMCMKYLCTKLVHSSSVSCVSLHSQHCPEVDPSKTHLQLGEQCQLLHWKPHHCHSLCPTYWHGRCWNSDGQSQKSSRHSLELPLALRKTLPSFIAIKADQQYSDIHFGEDAFLIIYLLKNREAPSSVGPYADLLASCWSDIFT